MAISYPVRSEGRAAFRRVVEALAQALPVTAALAHLYGYTHPSQFEQDIEDFQRQIAAATNDHEERITRLEAILAPHARLSILALDVGFYVLRTNTDGRRTHVAFDVFTRHFKNTDRGLLEEAIAELCNLGYAATTAVLGHPIHLVCPLNAMFLAFDLAATGHDTRADALEIAGLWLQQDPMRNVFRLQEHLGWEPRRLNPALSALRHVFPDGRWSGAMHPTLETTSVLVTPDERFQLRRIVETKQVD